MDREISKFLDEHTIVIGPSAMTKDESLPLWADDNVDQSGTIARLIIQAASAKEPSFTNDTDRVSPLYILGLALCIRRREQKIGIEELAKIAGIDSKTIYSIEVGVAPLGVVSENLSKICTPLGLDYTRISRVMMDLVLES